MEVALEQFISADKSKNILMILKKISCILIFLGLILLMIFFMPIGIVLSIIGLILFFVCKFAYVDYEYELYNGNIDISKIYSCTKRKMVHRIKVEDVDEVYVTKNNQIGKNGAKAFFNSNINSLTIYTFKLKNSQRVQVALNQELEKVVKIIYRSKII